MSAPSHVRCRRKLSLLPILLLAGLNGFASAQAPEERAKALAESEKFFEAAELYQSAVSAQQKRLAEHPDDGAVVAAWGACRNGLAEQRVKLSQFPEAKALVDETMERLQAFLARDPENAAVRLELAHAWEQRGWRAAEMGLNEEAARHLVQALDIHRKLAGEPGAAPERRSDLTVLLAGYACRLMTLGRYQEAITVYEEALAVARKLVIDCPDSQKAVEALALTVNSYALLVRESGQFGRAADMIREAIRLMSKLETKYPDRPEFWYQLPTFYRNLSIPLTYLGSANEAALAKREADRLDAKLAKYPEAAKKWLKDSNKLVGAMQTVDAARLSALKAEAGGFLLTAEADLLLHPDVPVFRLRVYTAKLAEGVQLLAAQGSPEARSPEECLRPFEQALEMSDKMAEQYPDVLNYLTYAANVRITLGIIRIGLGQREPGEKVLEEGITRCRQLADAHPGEPALRQKLAESLLPAVTQYLMARDWDHAARMVLLVRTESKKLADAYPTCPIYRRNAVQACEWQARLGTAKGDTAAAESSWRESIALWRRMIVDFPTNPDNRRCLADALWNLGQLLTNKSRDAELMPMTAEMLHLHEDLARAFPGDSLYLAQIAIDHANYAGLLEHEGKNDAALDYHKRAIDKMEEAMRANPRRRDLLESQRRLQQNLADLCLKLGKQAEYEAVLAKKKAIEEYLDAPLIRISRVTERLTDGRRAAALREADDLFANCDLTASYLEDLAAFYVTAAASEPQTQSRETYTVRAVETLRRACDLGRMSFVALDADPRFRTLADREDFKKLVAEQRQ